MKTIVNPVLRGFNPDPSIVRVGEDYYLATSTFEWFPGVQLHHSRDLMHWHLVGQALTRVSQLDLRGIVDSGGVWAPSLSYADGKFWLIYTNLRSCGAARPFKDLTIFLTTSPTIDGPWSEPISLNSIGFDPSLFHDDDGTKWLVNMVWDHRQKGASRFAGIVIQQYDHATGRLVGPTTRVLKKPGIVEGPNIYKRDDWYYLMTAEGGTGWEHGIAMARSRTLSGPYEIDPQPFLLTSAHAAKSPLQKAGHGELVKTPEGEWYLAHLASRPLGEGAGRRCMLGRETCLQKVQWSPDGWLRLESGGTLPELKVPAPKGVMLYLLPQPSWRDDFDATTLDPSWNSLRVPVEEHWASLVARPGWLRLRGRDSLHSFFTQSLVAKRLQSFCCVAETCLEFEPTHFTQAAGLICYYDTRTHFYLRVTHDEIRGKILGIALSDDGAYQELAETEFAINDWKTCYLRATIEREALKFFASPDGSEWRQIGAIFDATKLSDDYGTALHFTGAFVGLCAQDLATAEAKADFDYFILRSTE
ncbi:MAG TPA: glycoside hydrolase family 43 protein [Opitutaceae bacterium]|nr:glycoside hydrolase family 43 protein [Opitutaceae bacterium]